MAVQLLPPFTAGLGGDTQRAQNNYIRQAFKLLPDGVLDLFNNVILSFGGPSKVIACYRIRPLVYSLFRL